MAQQVDGSIRINTLINIEDFKKGIAHIKESLKNFGNVTNSSLSRQNTAFTTLTGKVKETEIEINNLTTKISTLKAQPITNTTIENLNISIKNTSSDIDNLKNKIAELQNKTGDIKAMTKFQSQIDTTSQKLAQLYIQKDQLLYSEAKAIAPSGTNITDYLDSAEKSLKKNSTEWKTLEREITKAENEISKYKQQLEVASKIKGVDTAEYAKATEKLQKLNAQLTTYQDRLKSAETTEKSKISAQYDKLAEQLEKANIKLETYRQKMNNATSSTEKHKKSVSGLSTNINTLAKTFNKLLSTLGIVLSVRSVLNWAKAWKSAYTTQLQVETQLETVMKNNTNATNEQVQAMKDLTATQQQLGVVGDEVQIAGLQELSTYTQEISTLEKLLPLMNDLATQRYGFTVTTENATAVADLFGKALNGNATILTRNGYVLTETQKELIQYGTESEKVAVLVDVIGSSVGGMNKALANTDIGKQVQLSNTLGDIKELYGNIVSKIYTLLLPALNKLADILVIIGNTALNVLKAIYKLLGKDFNTSAYGSMAGDIDTATDNTEALTSATEDLANAQEDLNQEVKGNLASFDELEVVSFNNSSGTSSIADDTDALDDNTSAISNLNNATADLSDTTDDYTIKNSKLLNSLARLKEQLDRLGEFTGQALIDFYEHFLKPLGSWAVNEALPRFIDALSSAMAKVDWQKINDALIRLWDALEPFTETVGEGLLWFWDNVLTPLGTWVLNKAVPTFLDLLSASIELLHAVILVFKPFGLWIWEQFLKPIAKWTGGVIISVLSGITSLIQDLTNYLKDNSDEIQTWIPLVSGIAMAIGSAFAIKGLSKIAPTFLKIGTVIVGIASKVKTLAIAFGTLASTEGIFVALKTAVAGLWTTFTAFMTSLSPLAKVGVTVVGIVATFTTAYSAIKKLSDGSLTLAGALKNIIPVTVAVGVALYAMMGSIGIVITVISTLVGACAGAISATNEMAQNIVSNAIFNDAGTPITEYANTIHNLADTISSEQDKILSLGDTIESNNQAIESNLTELGMLIGQVNATGELTEESANKIISSFNAVADGISENLSLETQSIIEGLGTSFTDLAGTSGTMVSDMLSQLYLLQSEGDAYLATMKSDFANANMEMLNLEKGTPEYEKASKKVEELRLQIGEYSAITNDAVTSADLFTQSLSNINDETISLMDSATATQSINDMTNDYSKAMEDLEEARAVALKGVENEMKALEYRQGELTSKDIKYFDNLTSVINENYNSQESEITKAFESITTKIENQMSTAFDGAMIDAEYSIYHSLGGFGEYLKESLKNFGSDTTAEESIRNNLYETIAGGTSKAIEDAKTTINQKAYESGLNIDKGYAKGIDDNSKLPANSIIAVGEHTHGEFQRYNKINSPSKLYEEDGEYIDKGLALGIDNKKQLVINSMLAVATEMKNQLEVALTPISNVFDDVFNRILNSMNNFNNNLLIGIRDILNNIINDLNTLFNGINQVNFDLPMGYGNFGVNIPQIPHLATGGLIPPRSEFMAILGDNTRENEIVSPVSAMVDAMKQAITETGLSNNQNITVNVDGRELFTIIVNKNRQYIKQTGKSAF